MDVWTNHSASVAIDSYGTLKPHKNQLAGFHSKIPQCYELGIHVLLHLFSYFSLKLGFQLLQKHKCIWSHVDTLFTPLRYMWCCSPGLLLFLFVVIQLSVILQQLEVMLSRNTLKVMFSFLRGSFRFSSTPGITGYNISSPLSTQ